MNYVITDNDLDLWFLREKGMFAGRFMPKTHLTDVTIRENTGDLSSVMARIGDLESEYGRRTSYGLRPVLVDDYVVALLLKKMESSA